jgi:hypothetical protein
MVQVASSLVSHSQDLAIKLTMFERDNYGGERKMDLSNLEKTRAHPIDIGSRGI